MESGSVWYLWTCFPFKRVKFEFENQGIWTFLFKNKIIFYLRFLCFFQISSSLRLAWIHTIWIFKHISVSIFKENSFCSRILAKITLGREEDHQGPMTPLCTELKSGSLGGVGFTHAQLWLTLGLSSGPTLGQGGTSSRPWRREGGTVSDGDPFLSGPCRWPTVSSSKEEDSWTCKGNWTRIRLEISPPKANVFVCHSTYTPNNPE